MKVISGSMITSTKTQKVIAGQEDTKNVMFLARHTDDKAVQETILRDNSDNKKVLVALAGNHELASSVESALAEKAKEHPAIARALISRREAF